MGPFRLLRWILFREGQRDNPIAGILWRAQLRHAQVGMLLAGTLFITGVTLFGKISIRTRPELVPYLAFRWGLAEFFWIWMSADHLFSTVRKLKRQKAFEEWHLTRLEPDEIRAGFLGPVLTFLLLGSSLHCGLDALIPFGHGIGLRSSYRLFSDRFDDVAIWRIALSAGFWVSTFGTLLVACGWSFRVAIESTERRVHSNWFNTLCRSGLVLCVVDFVGLLAGILVAAIGMLVAAGFGLPVERRAATIVGAGLFLGALISGVAKITTLGRREWEAVRQSLENEGYLTE